MQTVDDLQLTIDRILKITRILIDQDKPIRLLIDIRDLSDFDQRARLLELHARTILPFWKMAFVTLAEHTPGEQVSRTLTLMSGRKGEIRYFQREDDAVGWLSFMRGQDPNKRIIPIK